MQATTITTMESSTTAAATITGFLTKLKKIGSDDPRRIVHSFKVGLGLALVSALYYINPVFDGLGQPLIWAVITVVLVMEFTVGAAISKGLNRAFATFLAGAMGAGAHYFAALFGEKGEPVVLGAAVFIVAALATFVRFVPALKARYDYGVVIFILTFCMVTVSSYRNNKILNLANERLYTIAIGVVVSFLISVLVFPVWAGEDLHALTAGNLEKLASAMQSVGEALKGDNAGVVVGDHKGVIGSKATEDSLANLVWWEPWHGRFAFRHPWHHYVKLGRESRRCACLVEALSTYLRTPNNELSAACAELSLESSEALREATSAVRTMRTPVPVAEHCVSAEERKASLLENCGDVKEVLHFAPIVSLLIEILCCARSMVASVEELARLAHFSSSEAPASDAMVKLPADVKGSDHVTIVVEE